MNFVRRPIGLGQFRRRSRNAAMGASRHCPVKDGRRPRLRRQTVLKHQLAELEEAVCRDTQQKRGDEGCDICGRPNAMDDLTHNTHSRLTPSSLKLGAFATPHALVAASEAMVLLYGAGLGANLQAMTKGESVQWPSVLPPSGS